MTTPFEIVSYKLLEVILKLVPIEEKGTKRKMINFCKFLRTANNMTIEEIENTDWGKEVQRSTCGKEAIAIAYAHDSEFSISKSDEAWCSGDYHWVIVSEVHNPGFWMDAFKKKKDAVALCKKMGWKVIKK